MTARAGGEDPFYEIMRILGRLEEGQKRQQEDVEEVKETARESRDKTHAKLDHLDGTVAIVGQVAAQAREESAAVKKVPSPLVGRGLQDHPMVGVVLSIDAATAASE